MTTGMSTAFQQILWAKTVDWLKMSKISQSLYWFGFRLAVKVWLGKTTKSTKNGIDKLRLFNYPLSQLQLRPKFDFLVSM
jgi:hypothetical protein